MKKILYLCLFLLGLTVSANAQYNTGISYNEAVKGAMNSKCIAIGDLNGDNIKDIAVVKDSYERPFLAIYWGLGNSRYQLQGKYPKAIAQSSMMIDPKELQSIRVISGNKLYIDYSSFSMHQGVESGYKQSYIFEWRNGGFYLRGIAITSDGYVIVEDYLKYSKATTHNGRTKTENLPQRALRKLSEPNITGDWD